MPDAECLGGGGDAEVPGDDQQVVQASPGAGSDEGAAERLGQVARVDARDCGGRHVAAGTAAADRDAVVAREPVQGLRRAGDLGGDAEAGRVYGIDMPGDANPSVPHAPLTPPASCAAWLDELLAQLSGRPAHLVGFSYGGWVAMNQAIRAPGRVASITLLDSAGLTRLDELNDRIVAFIKAQATDNQAGKTGPETGFIGSQRFATSAGSPHAHPML
jgi:hypothetical protein